MVPLPIPVIRDVVSLGGTLRLRKTAFVNGDAVTVGGRLEKDPGAQVLFGELAWSSLTIMTALYPAAFGLVAPILWRGRRPVRS